MRAAVIQLESWFETWCYGAGYSLDLLVRTLGMLGLLKRKWNEVIYQLHKACFGSLAIVFLTGLFSGMILALQTGIQLAKYGQEGSIGYLVAAAMCREMGPVMTGIAIAGLMGSTYAAELGTMKVNEEIDALEVMSIDPVYFLVLPRILALTVAAVALTICADVVGICGGAMVGKANFRVSLSTYFGNARDVLDVKDIMCGLIKSFVFGATISTIACSHGLRTDGGAEGVGNATLRTVVYSFIFILMFNYFLTWMIY